MAHLSVLLKESIDGLAIDPKGIYIDGTFGRGGHSQAILNALSDEGRLFAMDKDEAAITHAKMHFLQDPRFHIEHASFGQLKAFAERQQILGKVNGILLDLGVSSPQLDEASRGFSFMKKGPLDMRMDQSAALDAATFIKKSSVKEMAQVFRAYGEERFALRIARAIEQARDITAIESTDALAAIVKEAHPRWEKHKHPATRVFQAIRIHVNSELSDLEAVLSQAVEVLAVGGRLSVISFHSLEDRIVKQFMRKEEEGARPPISVPIRAQDYSQTFKRVGKAMKPGKAELEKNVRARSAVLRIGEKTKEKLA